MTGGNPIRQNKVFLPFHQILDHVLMMRDTWGNASLIPVTKQGSGEGGRGQMILPVAEEDTATTQQYVSISGEAGERNRCAGRRRL